MSGVTQADPIPLILVGDGARAKAWLEVISRAARLELVARVPLEDLERALDEFPTARAAVALPPRAGLEAALVLARRRRAGLIEAPVAAYQGLIEGAERVQVAHGWATALTEARRAAKTIEATRYLLECRGLPEEPGGSLEEQLPHALAAAYRLAPGAALRNAYLHGDMRLELELATAHVELRLGVHAEGHGLRLEALGPKGSFQWQLDAQTETFSAAKTSTRPATPAVERALRQLVEPGEEHLSAAQEIAVRAAEVWAACGSKPQVSARRFAQSARALRSEAHRRGPLAALGLCGEPPDAVPAPEEQPARLGRCTELWSFRAGLKPVVFLTVRPEEEAATLASFGEVHVERLVRKVRVEAQDRWVDRRDEGEPYVELYLSREPGLAARAASLQQHPSGQLAELGALLGYPACCIAAFAAQRDRANNTANRYATGLRTASPGPWPWQLNNLSQMLLAFFPCRYDCPRALAQANAALVELERAHPGALQATRAALGRDTLYFSHGLHLALAGEVPAVAKGAPPALARLAAAAARGLTFTDEALIVGGHRLARCDPALGLWAPFGLR
jgi:hypothetical protein